MTPSEVRARLLAQHDELRILLGDVRTRAARHLAGEPVIRELELALIALRDAYVEHNRYELRVLEPMLRDADAWGPARVARMLEEHAAEHVVLEAFLEGKIADVIPRLDEFAEEIDAHMAAEERTFLSPKVLHDSPTPGAA